MTDDLISRADAKAACQKVADEAKGYGIPQMAMGAHTCRDAIIALPAADLSSPLGVVAMRDAALKAIMDIWAELLPEMLELGLQHPVQSEIDAIRALPLPTHADLLAHALKLPEVAAMREALVKLRDLMCENFEDDDGNSGCGQCQDDCTGCLAHATLSARGLSHRKESLHLLD